MIRIEKWAFATIPDQNNPYTPPELLPSSVCGNVYGHSRFPDGHFVFTSSPVGWNEQNGTMVTASGSEYILGEIDPEYEKKFPNAKERFLERLKKMPIPA